MNGEVLSHDDSRGGGGGGGGGGEERGFYPEDVETIREREYPLLNGMPFF